MKPIRWSQHALKNLAEREVPREEADQTPRTVYMRRYYDARLRREMLVRAVVEETPDERVVTTVYITSKIGKYMKGA